MERTGYFQQRKQQAPKPPKKLSFWKHLVFIWAGGIVLWPTLTAVLAYAIMPDTEAFTMTMLVVVANIFLGWIPAIIVFFIHWGIRGWITMGKNFSAERSRAIAAQAEANSQSLEPFQQTYLPGNPAENIQPSEAEMLSQWKAMNPYGCCMDHRDSEGYPSHGGPDCLHPSLY